MRRLIDVCMAICLAPLVFCVCTLISVAIKWESPGPALFRSKRIGENGSQFVIYKLRTMSQQAPLRATADLSMSSYVTKVGKILRSYSLDELPQFMNILNGSMTLIGPRPCLECQSELISLRSHYGIIEMKPGLTGLAQVSGRDSLTIKNKVRYECFYYKKQSICLDLRILLLSILKVVKADEVSH